MCRGESVLWAPDRSLDGLERDGFCRAGDGGDQLVGFGGPAEERLDHGESCVMICSLLIAPNGFCAAIREQQTPIVTVESVSQSRLDAHAGRTTSEDQRRDRSATQDVIEVGFEEPAVAVLGYDKIAGLRGEFVD